MRAANQVVFKGAPPDYGHPPSPLAAPGEGHVAAILRPSAARSVADFIGSLILPIDQPILDSEPPLRTSRIQADNDREWQVCRSTQLAGKSAYRDPNPERLARRVLLNK